MDPLMKVYDVEQSCATDQAHSVEGNGQTSWLGKWLAELDSVKSPQEPAELSRLCSAMHSIG